MAQPSQGFNPTQAEMTQPFLIDLLRMYPPQHDYQDDNASNVSLSFQTSHTHGNIECGPNHEPLFLPIPPSQESVYPQLLTMRNHKHLNNTTLTLASSTLQHFHKLQCT